MGYEYKMFTKEQEISRVLCKNVQFVSFLSFPTRDFLDMRFFHKSSENTHKYNYILCSCHFAQLPGNVAKPWPIES